jgi:hypothetical protein
MSLLAFLSLVQSLCVPLLPLMDGSAVLRPSTVSAAADMVGQAAPSETGGAAQRGRGQTMNDLQSCILRHWVHSHEEDAEGIRVYRPSTYKFPPARGRTGFEFRENGKLVYYGIQRADGVDESPGRWVIEEPNRIKVSVEHERIEPFVLEVVSCDEEMLKVKK